MHSLEQAKELVSKSPGILRFFGGWIAQELEEANQAERPHIVVGYLASPDGPVWAKKMDEIFRMLTESIPSQCPRLRRKVTGAVSQADLEAVLFELEIGSLLLECGHMIEVEPLYPEKGPDFRTVLHAESIYIEAKKLQHDAIEQSLWNTRKPWARILTQSFLDRREWNLHQRYLAQNQFPEDGFHVLGIDVSKSPRSATLLTKAWSDYCQSTMSKKRSRSTIHALVLCCREVEEHTSSSYDITEGVSILNNPSLSLPDDILETLEAIFGLRHVPN